MALEDDDTVCYCFHVPLRKIENFCRNTKPRYPSQISECLSAGTGCGWCVPLLKRIHRQVCGNNEPWWRQNDPQGPRQSEQTSADDYASSAAYAAARQVYLDAKKK